MKKETNRLAENFSGVSLCLFALPAMVMMVFQGLYTIVDTVFVARFVNTDALSAINIITPVLSLTVGLGTMLAAGGNAVISRNMGEGKGQLAKENFTLIFLSSAAAGTVLAAVIFQGWRRRFSSLEQRALYIPMQGIIWAYCFFFFPPICFRPYLPTCL